MLFDLDASGALTLLGGYSPSSAKFHFPRAAVCPYTGADDVEDARLPRTGTLFLWTAVTSAPPGYEGPVPYGFGVVELDDIGLRVIGRVTTAEPAALEAGQSMRVVADRWAGVTTWAFEPSGA
jgi:uncharacterized OB-fold protein